MKSTTIPDPIKPLLELFRENLRSEVRAAVAEALASRDEPPLWMTSAEAAELLGLHPAVVARKAKLGEIPASRVGGHYRFSRADLEAYIAGRRA